MPQQNLKIVQVGKYYDPVPGGMERVLKDLSEGLAERGHHVVCAVSGNHRSHKIINQNLVNIHRFPTLGSLASLPLTSWLRLPSLIKHHRADLVHLHIPNPLPLFFLRNISCPLVITYHADLLSRPLLLPVYKRYMKRYLNLASKVIVTSKEVLEFSQLSGMDFIDDASLEVIPLGVKVPTRPVPSQMPSPFTKPYILFLGRLVKYKGVSVLLNSMKSLETHLVIIGDGPERESLVRQAIKLGVQDKVKFLGYQTDVEVHHWLSHSEMLVLPSVSQSEAFGITLLEAMILGKPVISTNLGTGVNSVNLHKKTGLVVPPEDSNSLAQAIKLLLEDEGLRYGLGKQARQHCLEKFSLNGMIEKHLKLYQSLLI